MTVTHADMLYVATLAVVFHAIVFWHKGAFGWQPVLLPLDVGTWREVNEDD